MVFWEGHQGPPYPGHLQRGLVSSYFFCDLHHGQKQLGREKGLFHLILSGHPPSLREANLGNSSVEVPSSQVIDYRLYQIDKANQLNGFLFILISRALSLMSQPLTPTSQPLQPRGSSELPGMSGPHEEPSHSYKSIKAKLYPRP